MMKRLWMFLVALLVTVNAHAHKPSDSYLVLQTDGGAIQGQWDIALRDLDFAIGLDSNGDAEITWGEVKAKHKDIAAYAMARLAIQAGGKACPAVVNDHLIDHHTDGAYAVLQFQADCGQQFTAFTVDYQLLFDVDPQHKGLLRLESQGNSSASIFHPGKASQEFTLRAPNKWSQFIDYLIEGVWHIWIGFDHILFLLALLLPAVLWRLNGRWQPMEEFRPALLNVIKIVTAFTVAHSITLTLATLGVIDLPSRLIESVIAASVVVAALNNVYPIFSERRWAMAFGFGLVHGFGFASVLSDLGLPQGALILSLVGFNLGVELGQLAIVAVFLPVAYFIRRSRFYRSGVLIGGSVLIAALALVWFAERAFDLELLPF